MVWEDIIFIKKTPLVFMKKDKRSTVGFVERMCGPVLLDFYSSLPTPALVKDNTLVRTAKYARKQREEHGFEKLKWSAQSPDLNPIENLWYQMKTKIKLNGIGVRAMEGLKEVVRDVWNYITRA